MGNSFGLVLSSVEIYNREEEEWVTADWTLNSPTSGHCAVATSPSHILIIGGFNRLEPGLLRDVVEYNIDHKTSRVLPSLPYDVIGHACTMLNSTHVLVTGGSRISDITHKEVRRNDVIMLDVQQGVSGSWEHLPNLNRARDGHGMVSLAGHIYVLGGSWLESVERWTGEQWEEEEQGLQEMFLAGGAVVL